ncbi:MAG: hypothetical protein R2867_38795 [Caldilineaceae bacterium]
MGTWGANSQRDGRATMDDERLYAACRRRHRHEPSHVSGQRASHTGEAETAARRQLDAALPLCEKYNVQIGIQNHYGTFVGVHELGLHNLRRGTIPSTSVPSGMPCPITHWRVWHLS